MKAKLILKDGREFEGKSFGFPCSTSGEVVFNTAMTGYPESLTDPSYYGQILISTYPLVGNYGVPEQIINDKGVSVFFESENVQVKGFVVSNYSFQYSHWNAKKSLDELLKEQKVPGIYDVDTRAITKHIREKGSMSGKIIVENKDVDFYNPNDFNLVDIVSTKKKEVFGDGEFKILLIDCGVKNNIIRCLLKRNTQVTRVPWDYNFNSNDFDGILLSNGPGDPKKCLATIENVKNAMKNDTPIFGICLGNQIMALASGADTYKLKYGHRSHNQPVLLNGTNKCFITSQNHGFAINNESLNKDWEPFFTNVNDETNEGIKHKTKPFSSVQFHPEASSGPTDTDFLFDDFISQIKKNKK